MKILFAKKGVITAFAFVLASFCCVSLSFATSGFGGGSGSGSFSGGGFSTGTTSTVVSYDALSKLCLDLNDRLASGDLGANLKSVSCNIEFYDGSGSHEKYAIVYHYQGVNYWYCNASGGLVYSYTNPDSTLDYIFGYVENIQLWVGDIYSFTKNLLDTVINRITPTLGGIRSDIASVATILTSFIGGKTVNDIIAAMPSADNYTDILTALTNINNNFGDLKVALGDLNVTANFDDSAILAALEPITSFFNGEIRTTKEINASNGTLSHVLSYQQGTLSLIDFNVPADSDVIFLYGGKTGYYLTSNMSFDSSLCTPCTVPNRNRLGPEMKVDSDHISITVRSKDKDCTVPAGTYDISFSDASGAPVALFVGDMFLPGDELGVWVVHRAADGSEIRIGSTSGLPDGYSFSDLFYPCVRVKASNIIAAPSLFSYWLDCLYNGSLNKSSFRIISPSNDVAVSVSFATLHPILAWYAQQQNGFQTWLGNKLDSLPGGSASAVDLTGVTSRLDAILAQLQDTSGSATCDHTYQQHMEQEADCTLPGLQISTCSQCGDSYSEIIDPLGHDWVITSHVDAVTDPETGQETASAYDVYTCSRCGKTYEDHTGDGAPDEDYSSSSISQLVVKVFSKLGTFAGKLIGFIVRLFDKAISSVDEVISKFNEYTEQISGFGGDYPAWLTGFWTVLPSELQVALTFAVVCMVLGIVGKKLFFS